MSGPRHGSPSVLMEWARHGKNPGDHEGYRVLACSEGTLGVRNFKEAIGTFDPGTPDELPQVAVSYVSLMEHPDRRYLALTIAEYLDGRKDATGRLIAYTRYLCAPYRELATAGAGYLAMFHAFQEVDLPWDSGPPRLVSVPPVSLPVPPAGDVAVNVAAMLLTGRNVCVLGASQVSVAERLRFIDAVMWLLPYGMRAKMSAATWTRSTSQHRFRLFFSDNPRPALDGKPPDLVVVWERPDRSQQIPPQYPYAHEYLYWLRNALRSPGETLAGYIEEAGFSDASIAAMLGKIGVVASAPAPGPPAPSAPPDHAARILLAIDDRARREDLRGIRADVAVLSNVVERLVASSAAGLLPDSARKGYQDFIVRHQLLRPELREQLGRDAGAFSRALLRLAFGLPLSYQGYCELEDCLRAGSPAVTCPPAALLEVIRREGLADERVAALVMHGLGEKAMTDWFRPKLVNLAELAAFVAAPWDRAQHARTVCDMLAWYLAASFKRFRPEPEKVVAALRPHGYLAPALQARYPDDLSYQVRVLTSVIIAAAGRQTLREGEIVTILRGGDNAPTWALFCAVLQLLSPDEQELSILAQDAYFAGMLAKSGVGRDIRMRLGRHLSPDVEAIYQRLAGGDATQPMDHRMLEQARSPAALPPGQAPSFEPAQHPQPPRPEEHRGKRFGIFGGVYER